jgi:hypothetical protein
MLLLKKSTLLVAMLIFLFAFSLINAQTKVALLGGGESIEVNEPDVLLRDKLIAMDFHVEYIQAELVEDRVVHQDSVESFDLIVISGTIKPTKVRKLVDYGFPVPTINMDVASIRSSHHYLSIVSSFSRSGWLNKQDENANKIKIINGEHPIAAGYQNNQVIEAITNSVDYITTYPQAQGIVGFMLDDIGVIPIESLNTTTGDSSFVICGIEQGTVNLEDVTFKARYVQFNLNYYTIKTWNPEIDSLFISAIDWVLNPDTKVMQSAIDGKPKDFVLYQNYPNPFNPSTTIMFTLSNTGQTTLTIHNLPGQVVASLVNRNLSAGTHKLTFDASNLKSGVYFYQLKSNNYSHIKKMILIR